MNNPVHFAIILLFGGSVVAVPPEAWNVTSQTREAWSTTFITVDGQTFSDSHAANSNTDFGLFETTVATGLDMVTSEGFELFGARSGGRAIQESNFNTRSIFARTLVGTGAETFSTGSSGESDAMSSVTVEFEIVGSAALRLTGLLDASDGGQCNLLITGPAGFQTWSYASHGTYDMLDDLTAAPEGMYSFQLDAFSDAATSGSEGYDFQGSDCTVELSLMKCGTPSEPVVVEDIAYATNGTIFNGQVYRNTQAASSQDWTDIGRSSSLKNPGVAVNPTTNELYLLDVSGHQSLSKKNPNTVESLSAVGVHFESPTNYIQLLDMAFRPDGVLYGIWESNGVGRLGTVDITTGLVTDTGITPFVDATHGAAMSFDPVGGLLYNAAGTTLHTIDVDTGTKATVSLQVPSPMTALAFYPSGQPLIAGTDSGTTLVINLATGNTSPVFDVFPVPGPMSGLAIMPSLVLDGGPGECVQSLGTAGDVNNDSVIDLADAEGFLNCVAGPGIGFGSQSCIPTDMNGDGDTDLEDFRRFTVLVSGS